MVNWRVAANGTPIPYLSIAVMIMALAAQIPTSLEETYAVTTDLMRHLRKVEASVAITADIPGSE
jgi:hypothetical protein